MSSEAESDPVSYVQGLFVQHLPALRGFVLSLVSNFNLVDDVVQETFVTITNKADSFERGTNFRAWAWTIARFKTLQMLEKSAPVKERFVPDVIDALCAHEAAEEWHTEEMLRHLARCTEQLAPKARQSIELRYSQAHRPPEIARVMGWTVDAVHVVLARARVALRECVTRRMAAEGRSDAMTG
jgi:RNA polymerase sigma-70 factor, ECF subfamily